MFSVINILLDGHNNYGVVCLAIATRFTVAGYPKHDDSIGWCCHGASGLCSTSTGWYVHCLIQYL